jgi:hypothetical protein
MNTPSPPPGVNSVSIRPGVSLSTTKVCGTSPGDPERLVLAVMNVELSPVVERLGRALIRLTVDAGAQTSGREFPRRGYRRVEWIESALSPWRERMGPAHWRRLVAALAVVAGWEALIVQSDVCGLSASEGEAMSVWAARAFLQATAQELRGSRSWRRRGSSRSMGDRFSRGPTRPVVPASPRERESRRRVPL